ncbi:hypothetical protein D5018_00070 [Parashewanella curva]|uniref:Death domain-containing protein n=1 Tax=Parashewanella curva TaxID=2338552 RepID=A0A3L8Q1P3_9GAMM|nr:hypothetical protein [Parashewanella curva]RLV61551.1 hypothetical protein D5018_00070 [Parashewanella curva]
MSAIGGNQWGNIGVNQQFDRQIAPQRHWSVSQNLTIRDLESILSDLGELNDWQNFGLGLGLIYTKLEQIERDGRGQIEQCKRRMLSHFLTTEQSKAHGSKANGAFIIAAIRRHDNWIADEILAKNVNSSSAHASARVMEVQALSQANSYEAHYQHAQREIQQLQQQLSSLKVDMERQQEFHESETGAIKQINQVLVKENLELKEKLKVYESQQQDLRAWPYNQPHVTLPHSSEQQTHSFTNSVSKLSAAAYAQLNRQMKSSDLNQLMGVMRQDGGFLQNHWRVIGEGLGINPNTLSTIETEESKVGSRAREMLMIAIKTERKAFVDLANVIMDLAPSFDETSEPIKALMRITS